MNTPRTIDEIMNEMNDRAKAEGRYLGQAFWEVPPSPGSILDVPPTPEVQQRITALRARRLDRRRAAAEQSEPAAQIQDEVKAHIRENLQEGTAEVGT